MAALVAWLWQGMALTLGVAALLRVTRSLGAATRYALWWATLAAVLALPFAPALAGFFRAAPEPAAAHVATAPARLVEPWLPVALPAPADWLVAVALGVWLGFLVLGLLSLWRAAAHLSALRRGASAVPAGREAGLTLWLSVRHAGRRVSLAQSRDVTAPAALGLGRAMVVLPRTLLDRLRDDEIDQIVLHEYGHLRRRDDWARLAQALIQSVVWFHPAVWWIDGQLELEREAACDDFVVRQTGAARRYAACLARAAELAGSPDRAGSLAPGMAGSRRVLLARVGRLLDGRARRQHLGLAATALAAGVAALTTGVGSLAQSRPLVAVAAPIALVSPAVSGPAARLAFASAPIAPLGVPVLPAPIRQTAPAVTPVLVLAHESEERAERSGAQGSPRAERARRGAGAPAASTFAVPGAPVPPLGWVVPSEPVLEAAPLVAVLGPVAAPMSLSERDTTTAAGEPADRGPWGAVAVAGTSVGVGVKKAGVATAGFFTRLGRSIAGAF